MKVTNKKETFLNPGYYKILYTVSLLNNESSYPKPSGVFNVLSKKIDDETKAYSHLPCYGLLLSYSSKKISRMITMLVRYQYLEYFYHKKTDELYLRINEKGKKELNNYLSKHKFKNSCKSSLNCNKQSKPNILKIN